MASSDGWKSMMPSGIQRREPRVLPVGLEQEARRLDTDLEAHDLVAVLHAGKEDLGLVEPGRLVRDAQDVLPPLPVAPVVRQAELRLCGGQLGEARMSGLERSQVRH